MVDVAEKIMLSSAAKNVVAKCGGVGVVAQWTGLNRSTIHRWSLPRGPNGGRGGLIPSIWHKMLIDKAKAQNIVLKPEDFFG